MFGYQIIGFAGGGWALSVDKANPNVGGRLIAAAPNHQDADQQWLFLQDPNSGNLMLYNPHRGLAASAPPAQYAAITLATPDPNNSNTLWTMVGNGASRVFRTAANDDNNLTIGGQTVNLENWMRGDSSQLWAPVLVTASTATATRR